MTLSNTEVQHNVPGGSRGHGNEEGVQFELLVDTAEHPVVSHFKAFSAVLKHQITSAYATERGPLATIHDLVVGSNQHYYEDG